MTKIVRTARGDMVDWDLLRVQLAGTKSVTPVLEVASKRNETLDRRARRSRLNAAQNALKQAEDLKKAVDAAAAVSEASTVDDNGWEDDAQPTAKSKRGS